MPLWLVVQEPKQRSTPAKQSAGGDPGSVRFYVRTTDVCVPLSRGSKGPRITTGKPNSFIMAMGLRNENLVLPVGIYHDDVRWFDIDMRCRYTMLYHHCLWVMFLDHVDD